MGGDSACLQLIVLHSLITCLLNKAGSHRWRHWSHFTWQNVIIALILWCQKYLCDISKGNWCHNSLMSWWWLSFSVYCWTLSHSLWQWQHFQCSIIVNSSLSSKTCMFTICALDKLEAVDLKLTIRSIFMCIIFHCFTP